MTFYYKQFCNIFEIFKLTLYGNSHSTQRSHINLKIGPEDADKGRTSKSLLGILPLKFFKLFKVEYVNLKEIYLHVLHLLD